PSYLPYILHLHGHAPPRDLRSSPTRRSSDLLVEEVGELAKALIDESRERVRQEAIQVAVMAMRVVLDGDRTLDAWRESKGLDPLVVTARRGADRNSNRTVGP